MTKIITTSELQKHVGQLIKWLSRASVIVTNRGKASAVVLPYFEENDEAVERYMEDFEMYSNADKLRKEAQESYKSGLSDLVV